MKLENKHKSSISKNIIEEDNENSNDTTPLDVKKSNLKIKSFNSLLEKINTV